MLEDVKRVHLIGIAGTGMRAIANVLIEQGYSVTGSDIKESDITKVFAEKGATIYIGHEASHVEGADLVVISTAIHNDNPELVRAKELGISIIHRSDIVKLLLDHSVGITVAGAHGKTTTTSMLGQIFEEAQLDPTIVIGGEVDYLNGNSKLGKGKFTIAEADESDGSFLKLNPHYTVITNIENDHMDYYGTRERLLEAFQAFIERLPEEGLAVVCGDNVALAKLSTVVKRRFRTYGFHDHNDYVAKNIRYQEGLLVYDVWRAREQLTTITLQVPGNHNVLNSLGAYVMARFLGVDEEMILSALYKFIGAKRRFEKKGMVNDIRVVDDYAHHPTEIGATLSAAKGLEKHRVVCVFQPHRYTRTQLLRKEFGTAFKDADVVVLTDIYSAGEDAIPGIDGHTIPNEMLEATGQKAILVESLEELVPTLKSIVLPGDLVITMGAGSINQYGPKLLSALQEG